MLTSLVIPLLAIVVLYINMLMRLWRGSAATGGPGPARGDPSRKAVNSASSAAGHPVGSTAAGGVKGRENKRRVTRMILVVIVVFALCWSPLQLVLVLDRFGLYDITSTAHHIFKVYTVVCHVLGQCERR